MPRKPAGRIDWAIWGVRRGAFEVGIGLNEENLRYVCMEKDIERRGRSCWATEHLRGCCIGR